MKTPNHPPIVARLAIISLLFSLVAGIMVGDRTYAQSGSTKDSKVAKDLSKQVKESSGSTRVTVIMRSTSTWGATLDTAVKNSGGTIKRKFTNFNFRTVELPASAVDNLANRTDISFVSLDKEVKPFGHVTVTSGTDAARSAVSSSLNLDGSGIGIAIIDSGIDPNHQAFKDGAGVSRIIVNQDFTGENRTDDPYGHGTHVASIAAGNASIAQGAYLGIASNAKLINLRVLNAQGVGTVSGLLAALDWLYTNAASKNIRVVNMSIGMMAVESYMDDPVCLAVRRLVDSGIVVLAAAGNNGKNSSGGKLYGQIHSPGNEPSAITVGAVNTFGTDSRADDTIATYSSRGPTRSYWTDALGTKHYDNLIKPDISAPGNRIIAAESPNNLLLTQNPSLDAGVSPISSRKMMTMSGTSMATPVAAGAVALLLQANPKLTPNMVKALLMYTAQQLRGFNTFEQGAGELNLEGAVRLARLVRTDLTNSTMLNAPLLTAAAPAPTTTISAYQFTWSQGLILDHTYATGNSLITKYQKVYGTGVLLGDATMLSNGVLLADLTKVSVGVLLGDNILTSDGVLLADGTFFCSNGVLLGDGVILGDGVLMGDGVILGDGVLMGDGVLLGDATLQAQSARIKGDKTSSMPVVVD
jgi:subtilisin family serine protease